MGRKHHMERFASMVVKAARVARVVLLASALCVAAASTGHAACKTITNLAPTACGVVISTPGCYIIRNNLIPKLRTMVNTAGATKLASTTRNQNKNAVGNLLPPIRHHFDISRLPFPSVNIMPDLVPSRRRVPCLKGLSSPCVASITIRPLWARPIRSFRILMFGCTIWLFFLLYSRVCGMALGNSARHLPYHHDECTVRTNCFRESSSLSHSVEIVFVLSNTSLLCFLLGFSCL